MSFKKQNLKFIIQTLIAAAFLVFCFILVRAFYYAPSDEVALAPSAIQNIIAEQDGPITAKPIHLEIPKIKVDTDIREVGITRSGNMATPKNFLDAGWCKYGTIPGNQGSAVIAGHVDNGIALPAVFYNLKELTKGDEIFVTNDAGQRLRFVVTGTTEYDFNAKAEEVFTDDSGKLLKLITCSGVWIQANRTHNKRLVVTAELSP